MQVTGSVACSSLAFLVLESASDLVAIQLKIDCAVQAKAASLISVLAHSLDVQQLEVCNEWASTGAKSDISGVIATLSKGGALVMTDVILN